MGQHYVQLNNTFTVNPNTSIVLHVAQAPPNPTLLVPGLALLFVVVPDSDNGAPTAAATVLPESVYLNSTGTHHGAARCR